MSNPDAEHQGVPSTPIVLLSDWGRCGESPVERQLIAFDQAARPNGARAISLPPEWWEWRLDDLVARLAGCRVLYSGPWRGADAHLALSDALERVGARQLNVAADSEALMDIRHWSPRLASLTPKTIVLDAPDLVDARAALEQVGRPAFIKGMVKSRKASGIAACLARTAEEIVAAAGGGMIAVRQLLELKAAADHSIGMPRAREYRAVVLDGAILTLRYYWDGPDPVGDLTPDETKVVTQLVTEAAARLPGALQAIDVGQDVHDRWWVIEVGDPQFSGFAHSPHGLIWRALHNARDEAWR